MQLQYAQLEKALYPSQITNSTGAAHSLVFQGQRLSNTPGAPHGANYIQMLDGGKGGINQ